MEASLAGCAQLACATSPTMLLLLVLPHVPAKRLCPALPLPPPCQGSSSSVHLLLGVALGRGLPIASLRRRVATLGVLALGGWVVALRGWVVALGGTIPGLRGTIAWLGLWRVVA